LLAGVSCGGSQRFQGLKCARNRVCIRRFVARVQPWDWTLAALAMADAIIKGDNLLIVPGARYAADIDDKALRPRAPLTLAPVAEIGFAARDRYSDAQAGAIERFA